MNVLVVGDPHWRSTAPARRIDDFVEAQYRKTCTVRDLANKHKAVTVLLGDLFDTDASTNQTIIRYMKLLRTFEGPVLALPGNHDVYGANLETLKRSAYGVLEAAGVIERIDHAPRRLAKGVYIVGHTYMHADKPKPVRGAALNILATHEMVIGEKIWREQEEYELADQYLDAHRGWDMIFAGHFHGDFMQKDARGRYICNPGSLVRIKASTRDMAMDPGVLLLDTATRKIRRISLGAAPAKKVFDFDALQRPKGEDATVVVDEFVAAVAERSDGGELPAFGALSEAVTAGIKRTRARKRVAKIVRRCFEESLSA